MCFSSVNSILSNFARTFSHFIRSSSHLSQVVLFFLALPPLFLECLVFIQVHSISLLLPLSFIPCPIRWFVVKILRNFVFIFIQSCHLCRWIQFSYPWLSYPFQPLFFSMLEILMSLSCYSSLSFLSGVLKISQSFLFSILSIISSVGTPIPSHRNPACDTSDLFAISRMVVPTAAALP